MRHFRRSEFLTAAHSCAVLLPVHKSMNEGSEDNIFIWVCYPVCDTLDILHVWFDTYRSSDLGPR